MTEQCFNCNTKTHQHYSSLYFNIFTHPLSAEQSGILLQVRISMCLIFQFPPAIKSNLSTQFLTAHASHLKHTILKSDSFTDLNGRLGFSVWFGLVQFVGLFFFSFIKSKHGWVFNVVEHLCLGFFNRKELIWHIQIFKWVNA